MEFVLRVSVSNSEPTRPSFGRETSTVGDDPSPRRIHRDSIELVDFSAVSQGITRHSQVWDAVVSCFSATGSSKVARQKSSTAYSGQSLCIKLRTGYTGFATRSCQSSMAFHRRNAWRFVAIYGSEALYSNRTHTFIGSLGLYRTQRLVTSSRRS